MIPVQPQSEPPIFFGKVKEPGNRFLGRLPNPTSNQWKGKEYWRKILPEMRNLYGGICAYCAHWIPHATGNHSIEHFIPKSIRPSLAYEWSNYRYVSSRFNARKGTQRILDPFTINHNWFILDFTSFLIKSNNECSTEERKLIEDTIEILKLNKDEDLVLERKTWFEDFRNGNISYSHLERYYPFIAYELTRQNLV